MAGQLGSEEVACAVEEVALVLIEPHRHQTLAMMVCEGWATEDIAAAMCLTPEVVKRYTSGNGPKVFNDILTAYRQKFERYSVERRYRMAEHVEQAYQNIKEALLSNDIKFKTEQAWRILDEVAPKPVAESAPGVSLNVSLTRNHQVNNQIVQLGQDLLSEFQTLKSIDQPSYHRHLKTGADALPPTIGRANPDLDSDDDDEGETEIDVTEMEGTPSAQKGYLQRK